MPEFFDPTPEERNIVVVTGPTLVEAEKLIDFCEQCKPEGAEIPFDNILDRVTGSDPSVTDYILESLAKCPTAGARFWKRHSLNQREWPISSSPRLTFKLDATDFVVAAIAILDLFSYFLFDIKCGLVGNDDPCRHAGNARLPGPPGKGARFQLVDPRAAGPPTVDGLDPINFLA